MIGPLHVGLRSIDTATKYLNTTHGPVLAEEWF